jgi:hypothetical protein
MTVKIKKNWPGLTRFWPGGPCPGSTHRVDRVSPGQFPSGFLPQLGLIPGSGRPGPRSTRRAGPGFKTLKKNSYWNKTKGAKVKILANQVEKKKRKKTEKVKENKTNVNQPMWACQTCKSGHKIRINQVKARKEIKVQLQTNPM